MEHSDSLTDSGRSTDALALPIPPFRPHPLLRNAHLMTLFPRPWLRRHVLLGVPTVRRIFTVAAEARLLAYCHWQRNPRRHPTLVLVHGLEGCSDSHYMRGIAAKAWRGGFNVVRLNQRNCGGSEALSIGLYNNGLSGDLGAVVRTLADEDGLEDVWLGGYSMGGNLVLKLAGEEGQELPSLRGVVAVCPNLDPLACVEALELPRNRLYHHWFLRRMRARLKRKAELVPGRYDLGPLEEIRTLREFDEVYTAPDGGYRSAVDYYQRTGARRVLDRIRTPTLIITAQDDPFIPYASFDLPPLRDSPWIRLVAPRHGGHCGFVQGRRREEDVFWAENRLLDFVSWQSRGRASSCSPCRCHG